MSEEKTLMELMQEMLVAMKVVTASLEFLQAEQERLGKAAGEIGLLLTVQGQAIQRLWHHAGLPEDLRFPEPPPARGPIN